MLRASLTLALQEASDALYAHSAELAWVLLIEAMLVRAEQLSSECRPSDSVRCIATGSLGPRQRRRARGG